MCQYLNTQWIESQFGRAGQFEVDENTYSNKSYIKLGRIF